MLVLTRTKDESIFINGIIKVTIVDVRGERVRLGIEAPKDVEIFREEVYNEINKEIKKIKTGK